MAISEVDQPQNYNGSSPITNYTFWIRPGINFQNGEQLDARDVVWTMRYAMTPAWGSDQYSFIKGILGSNNSVYWQGEPGIPSRSTTLDTMCVHFNLTEPDAFFKNDIGTLPIMPSSVLVNSSTYATTNIGNWIPNYHMTSEFQSTSFATGIMNTAYSYYAKNGTFITGASGPFGAGPYKYVGTDLSTSTSHLAKWSGYFNTNNLQAADFYKINDYYVVNIPDSTSAVAALKAGDVQVLDCQYQLQNDITVLDPVWGKYVTYNAFEIQEMGLNMQSPIWGTGVATPLGQQTPSRAAEAALDVRRAFELCVPKETIISTLMGSVGVPGVTSAVSPVSSAINGQPAFIGFNSANYSAAGFTTQYNFLNYTDSQSLQLAMQELEAAGYTFPPATVNDLSATISGNSSVTLNWTAPGAEGNDGIAAGYTVEYSTSGPINASNWGAATVYTQSWTPAKNGTIESHVVTGLQIGKTYWFALMAYNGVPNYSGVSNSPNATLPGPSTTNTGVPTPWILVVAGVVLVGIVAAAVVVVYVRKSRGSGH
jgi:ABC-type transport system substrate-binding protein